MRLPPSRRLTFAVPLILGACRGFADAEKLQLEALGHDPGEKLFEAQAAGEHAQQSFILANDRLERELLWNEPLPTIGGASGRSRIEPRFSRIASTVADRSVQARCWSRSDWPRVLGEFHAWSPRPADPAGFAIPDLGRINLEPWSCEHLDGLTYRHEFPTGSGQLDMAWAVSLLSHETQHLVAGGTEAETECYGDQSIELVARALGAPSTYARALAVRYWRDAYPTLPANYRTNRCRNGGPLDAHANSSRWP